MKKKLCNKNKCLIDNKKLYVKALVYSRKSKKILNNISQSKTETIERFINDSLNIINDIDINKKIDNLNNTYINNQDTNIKNIIIGDTIYLDIKDVKMIKITTNNDDIKIELDKQGIQPRRAGNGLWNLGTLQSMLKNKSYTGLHSVNEYRTLDIDRVTKRKYKEVVKTYNYKIPKIINVGQ